MAHYAGDGKASVEGCRCWNGIGVAQRHSGPRKPPRRSEIAWTRDGERVASINVETVTLKYRSRSYGEDWSDVEQRVTIAWTPCRFGGERPWFVCSVVQTEFIAVAASPSCTVPGACSPAATAIGLPTRASRNRLISGGLGNPRRSECGWAEARTCLRSFPTSQEACTGGPMSDGAASMMLPKSDQPLA
jgi:hypothetical protein